MLRGNPGFAVIERHDPKSCRPQYPQIIFSPQTMASSSLDTCCSWACAILLRERTWMPHFSSPKSIFLSDEPERTVVWLDKPK